MLEPSIIIRMSWEPQRYKFIWTSLFELPLHDCFHNYFAKKMDIIELFDVNVWLRHLFVKMITVNRGDFVSIFAKTYYNFHLNYF